MDDPLWLFASLIVGGVGLALFMYGKKQQRWPQLVTGLLFMVYPYVTTNLVSLLTVGGVLGVGLWMAIRLGW